MERQDSPPRRYKSVLRTEQANATRHRVLEAAGHCFAAKGFTATTLGAIAAEAGVSVETVQSHGPKRRLLLAALETASAGVDGGRSILEVPGAKAVMAEENVREALTGLAHFAADLNARVVAKVLFGALDEMATNWILSKRRYKLAPMADQVLDIFLNGVNAA